MSTAAQKIRKVLRLVVGIPLSGLYALVMIVRSWLYQKGIFPVTKLPVFVISVGNLSLGGTGKTPMAEKVLRYLLKKGVQVGYISRGYGRSTRGYLRVNPSAHDYVQTGDEAMQVAVKFPNVPVAVCENRVIGAQALLKEVPNLQVIVLDDAFQHQRIHRDLDIVMIDATRPPWLDVTLPAGNLREPIHALKRADIIIVHNTLKEREYKKFQSRFRRHHPVFTRAQAVGLCAYNDPHTALDTETFRTRSCIVVSGIGNNSLFVTHVRNLGIHVLYNFEYRDHYAFKEKSIEHVTVRYRKMASQGHFLQPPIILTTEKDYMRLRTQTWFWEQFSSFPFYFLPIQMHIVHGRNTFYEKLHEKLKPLLGSYHPH